MSETMLTMSQLKMSETMLPMSQCECDENQHGYVICSEITEVIVCIFLCSVKYCGCIFTCLWISMLKSTLPLLSGCGTRVHGTMQSMLIYMYLILVPLVDQVTTLYHTI